MHIDTLGELTPHERSPGLLLSKPVEVPYFAGVKMRFEFDCIERDEVPDDVVSAVRRFLALTVRDRNAASKHVFKNYLEMCGVVGDDEVGVQIDEAADVWDHVEPDAILVSRGSNSDATVYIQITAECAWDPEHGLQLIYRGGSELTRVSAQDGHLTD